MAANRVNLILTLLCTVLAVAVSACTLSVTPNPSRSGPGAPGGDGTVKARGVGAFSQPAANLTERQVARFLIGDQFFTKPWSVASSGQPDQDGLGPTFLATSCAGCHLGDGRSSAPDHPDAAPIIRFITPDGTATTLDAYGVQLQSKAIDGVEPEADIRVTWTETEGRYRDGTSYTLRSPIIDVSNERFGSLTGAHASGLRSAPALIGVGLLEAIPADDIRSHADPDDLDGDGISGVASVVETLSGEPALGRFGLKANIATVADQTALAYLLDLGITSPMMPDENCPIGQVACSEAPTGGNPEISSDRIGAVVFYAQTLGVPARVGLDDASVIRGQAIFESIGCDACHIERWKTGDHEVDALANQTIYPFTDMLLHDMGEGLGDGRTDGTAGPTEWRTPPLWGLGFTRAVNPNAGFLHDGRARSIEEAILWHGGEATASAAQFIKLDADDRERLLHFLKSL
ncbi:MAG: thiol oxidoreductase [Acidimicrobiia bacterium]|nr:thiol oxidoreductase [Acidimicrobiia bacterium]